MNNPSLMASFIFNWLVNSVSWADGRFTSRVWNRIWSYSCRRLKGPVRTVIHGHSVVVNYGHVYPVYTRRFAYLNNPLVELAHEAFISKGTPIVLVDVGAAVGDTVLLLMASVGGEVSRYHCIEGDPEFLSYLTRNLDSMAGVDIHPCLLSSHEGALPELVRTHLGTASAQGIRQVSCTTLDTVINDPVDVIKIDVDGYDGKVLQGAQRLLSTSKPAVIFEWHPILMEQTRNDWVEPFEVLASNGYDRFLLCTKYGDFSHYMTPYSKGSMALLADYCLSSPRDDWHYDVIAIHGESRLNMLKLSRFDYAKRHKSRY